MGLVALVLLLVGFAGGVESQQPKKVPRIGILPASLASAATPQNEAFLQSLRELGYVEGKSILFEYRFAGENLERLSDLAAELVRLKVDIIVIMTAIASLAPGRLVRGDVAMTGEITLRGKVLPVGGIKQKLLAAYREGIRVAILPLDNLPDLKDLPKVIKTNMAIHLVETMDDVLKIALTRELPKKPAEPRDKKAAALEAEKPARKTEDEAAKEPPLTN